MLDHQTSAKELKAIIGRYILLTQPMPEDSPGRRQAIEDVTTLQGLADYHVSKATTPDMHMKAEHIMQGMAQELQETLDAMDEAGNDPMAGASIQSLLDDHAAYWIETFQTAANDTTEDTLDLTPTNLKQAASRVLQPTD